MKNNPTNITSEGASKKLVPEFRFPEFVNDDEWISTSLGNKCIYVSSGKNKEKKEKGEFPVYGSTGVIGYSGSFVYDFPAILVARVGANAGQINKVTGKYDVTDNTIIIQLNDDCNLDYVYYFLASRNINIFVFGSGQPLITSSLLKKLILSLPSLSEQKRIAQCLSSLDELIAATKEKVELLKVHKRGLIQKLFPAKGKTLPELRFPEFKNDGDWEEYALGELTNVTNRRNKSNRKLPIYSISNKGGFIPQSEQFDGLDSNSRGYDISMYKLVGKNTFAYNPARINVGSIGYSGDLKEVIISSLYVCFKTTEKIEDDFLSCFTNTTLFRQSVEINVEGGIRSYLFYENFSKIKIWLPTITEQKKIASFFHSIDDLIDYYSSYLEILELQKIGLMQKIFPKIK